MGVDRKIEGVPPDVLRRLSRAKELMDDCYDLQLDLPQISKEACFSQFHFLRLFRQAYQETPHQYLIRRRIEKAKELLSTTRLTVTDVCFEVGFQSLGSFSTLFRKMTGQPPVDFRSRIFQPIRTFQGNIVIPGCFQIMYGLQLR